MINIKNVDPNLSSIDQISFKNNDFDITVKSLCGANPLYLVFNNVDAYIEENNEDKYLILASTDKSKEALENYTELWYGTKDQVETISGNKPVEYKKDFIKTSFESDDNLPLGKILNIPVCIIVARSVFQENSNYYPQACLHDECLHEDEYEDEDDSYCTI